MDCVEVCPVDCFYEGENMLVIHPDECIDCGVCEPECPVEAITPDTDDKAKDWNELNKKFLQSGLLFLKKNKVFQKKNKTNGQKKKIKKNILAKNPEKNN